MTTRVAERASENVQQLSLATLGIKDLPGVPPVIGPFGDSRVDATLRRAENEGVPEGFAVGCANCRVAVHVAADPQSFG